jgi:hypothetical protein
MEFRDFDSNATLRAHHTHIRFTDRLEGPFWLSTMQPAHQLDEMQFLSLLSVTGHCDDSAA